MVPAIRRVYLDDGLASSLPHDFAAEHRARTNDCASGAATDEYLCDGIVDGVSAIRSDRAADNDQFRSNGRVPAVQRLFHSVGSPLRTSISRSTLLTALVIALLVVATPLAIAEFFRTGELYLLSTRFIDDLVARLHGPGRLRFILQPLVAIMLGARDGIKDARADRPPFLRNLLFRNADRPRLMRSALASVGDLLAVAIILDVISQFLIFRMVHPAAALVVGPVLIAFPYASSRALANRTQKWRSGRASKKLHRYRESSQVEIKHHV